MVSLELSSVSAYWHEGHRVIGHDPKRSVSLAVGDGEWVAVIGENGIGKSTLLHAIAGTVSFMTGQIVVDGILLPLRDITARFQAGVAIVPQQAFLSGSGAAFQDAQDLAFFHRPGLFNEVALGQLESLLREMGLVHDGKLAPRVFDLVVAIMVSPRILLLDEILTDLPADLRTANTYRKLKQLMPWTTVLFVDHDLQRSFEIADRALWLRSDCGPLIFSRDNTGHRDTLFSELGAEARTAGRSDEEIEHLWNAVALDHSPRFQVFRALKARGCKGNVDEIAEELFHDFAFLDTDQPAEVLSGGQRVVLLWIVSELSGISELPSQLLDHLRPKLQDAVKKWSARSLGGTP